MRVHLGLDNKNVCDNVGKVGRWLVWVSTLPLHTGGVLPTCIIQMLHYRLQGSVKVTQVKGHAADATVTEREGS